MSCDALKQFIKDFKRPSLSVAVGICSTVVGFFTLLAGLILGALTIWTDTSSSKSFNANDSKFWWELLVGLTTAGAILMGFGLCAVCGGCLGCYFGWVHQFRMCCGEECCLCIGDGCACLPEKVLESSCCAYLNKFRDGPIV
ncbi:hypothetical protein C9374_003643 [Naegleria lovaniensis]|uniref:Transmembrane protein n=1 Tax=Naegleria lovaniensis TaxID=51637 RepID=A0AA88KSQ1_NAELO|nr:uncharacterized protein C9374_003643 [Naegleria lovaniensis]KAG2393879.1 hypothetical protein C9374_003643 [Naegleria lovaniensis]